jgi:alkanesulfonate monooxygenase SsuD/methylene tetrahydromethanopterin reductase-like flavin-dependent oxidoreductase (luciferase family)
MKVGILFPSRFKEPGEFLADARAMEAAGADSVWLEEDADSLEPWLLLAAIAAVTGTLRLGLILLDSPSRSGGVSGRGLETLQRLSRQRAVAGVAQGAEIVSGTDRWRRVEVPADREAWAQTLEQAAPHADGVLVPLDPRLLDILRHPDDAIDRSDLLLVSG